MGYVPIHIYLTTGDKKYKKDFEKSERSDVIGISVVGGICLLLLITEMIYLLVFV